jgi:hypothetical protein
MSQSVIEFSERSIFNRILFVLHYTLYALIPAFIIMTWSFYTVWGILMFIIAISVASIGLKFELYSFPARNVEALSLFIPYAIMVYYVIDGVGRGYGTWWEYIQVQSGMIFAGLSAVLMIGGVIFFVKEAREHGLRHMAEEDKEGKGSYGGAFTMAGLMIAAPSFITIFVAVRTWHMFADLEPGDGMGVLIKFGTLLLSIIIFHVREAIALVRSGKPIVYL